MSNSDVQWNSTLVSELQEILADAAVTCLGYGCFSILAIISIRILVQRGLSSPGRRYLLAAVIVFLVSSTVLCATKFAFDLANVALGPFSYDQRIVKLCERLYVIIIILQRTNFLLNDGLVVWRAWVLAGRLSVRILFAVSMIITTGCAIGEAVLRIQAGIFAVGSSASDLLLYIPLLFNNIIATAMVIYKTWIYRTQIKNDLMQTSQKSQVESVLFLLIESGFIHCGYWVLFMISSYLRSVPHMMYVVIGALSPLAAAIYPMLIILVVEHQKSSAEQASARSLTLSLRFNVPQPDSNTVSIVQSIVEIQSAQNSDGRIDSVGITKRKKASD